MECWETLVSNLGILASSIRVAGPAFDTFEFFPNVSTTRQYTKLAFLNGTAVLGLSGVASSGGTGTGYASDITSSITTGTSTVNSPYGPLSYNNVAMRMGSASSGRVTIMRSTNGTTWATALNAASTGDYLTTIAYGNVGGTSIWISPVAGDNDVYRSTNNGETFTLQSNVLITGAWQISTRMGSAFAVFAEGVSTYYTSQDGLTWTARTLPTRWATRLGNEDQPTKFIASSEDTTVIYDADPGSIGAPLMMYTNDLVTWGTVLTPAGTSVSQTGFREEPAALTYGNGNFVFVLNATGTVAAYKSTNGSAWTQMTVNSSAIVDGRYLDVSYDSVTDGFYIVGGSELNANTDVWRALA
jgi:hypothetical protein